MVRCGGKVVLQGVAESGPWPCDLPEPFSAETPLIAEGLIRIDGQNARHIFDISIRD
jgi:hypothetical protein